VSSDNPYENLGYDNPYENYPSSSEEEYEDLETGMIIITKKESKYDKCSKCL